MSDLNPSATEGDYRGRDAVGKVLLSHEYLQDFSNRYHADDALRAQVDGGDLSPLAGDLGLDDYPEIEFRVAASTEDVYYMLMPPDPSNALSDEALKRVSAGGSTASTAGSLGSAGSMITSTTPSTFSTYASAGSAGTAA